VHVPKDELRFHLLCLLCSRESYGYDLRKRLQDNGVEVELPLLYHVLKDFAEDELLKFESRELRKDEPDGKARKNYRQRKYFQLTDPGRIELARIAVEKRQMIERVAKSLAMIGKTTETK
jgi:DNA-binding PadR family transcriptional regulator